MKIDVVICVHNALAEIRECISSLFRWASPNFRLILVDDKSDEPTRRYLHEIAHNYANVILIVNAVRLGYTRSVNIGLHASSAPFIVMANSDLIFTPQWSHILQQTLMSRDDIGITGPLSNAALWQSVPRVRDIEGKYMVNELPIGYELDVFALRLHAEFRNINEKCVILNGFAWMMKREVLDLVGYFDEQNFPEGYGEEVDYCIRCIDKSISLQVSAGAYIYHHKCRSFGWERRKKLVASGRAALERKFGKDAVDVRYGMMNDHKGLETIRQIVATKFYGTHY